MIGTNMKTSSDLNEALRSIFKEVGLTMEEVELTADEDSPPISRPIRILQSALAALDQGKFLEVVQYFDTDGCFRFSDHALTLEFTDKTRLTKFFTKLTNYSRIPGWK
jgi:hypothetical protein